MSRKDGFSIVRGYFLVANSATLVDNEEEDDEDDGEDFLDLGDYNVYSSSGVQIQSKPLKSRTVQFREYGTHTVINVQGNFQLTDPWWAATLQVRGKRGRKNIYNRYPKYALRDDGDVHNIMATFLMKCGVEQALSYEFLTALDHLGKKKSLKFDNLSDGIDIFAKGNNEKAEKIRQYLSYGTGEMVTMVYQVFKNLFEYLPQLLPRQFLGIVNFDEKLDDEPDGENESQEEKKKKYMKKKGKHAGMRAKIATILKDDPWAIGFANVMKSRCGLVGCEASIDKIYLSDLMDLISGIEKDALHVYDALKHFSKTFGHTYITQTFLRDARRFEEYQEKYDFTVPKRRLEPALEFLEEHEVIVREKAHGEKRIFLKKYWKAETGIAENIQKLLERDQENPSKFEINYDSPLFNHVKVDECQVKAAETIRQNPIACINGKGGCGKTTVVSAVFKHLEGIIKEGISNEEIDDSGLYDSDMDDLLSQCAQEVEDTFITCQKSNADEEESDPEITEQNPEMTEEKPESTGIKNKDFPLIILCAPTGKAANLIGQRAKLPSFTLHSVVMSYYNWKISKPADGGEKTPWRFHKVKALVVDECSLVSVCIFSNLLQALMDESYLQRVVLLGDVHQLPSIDAGNFLNDIYFSMEKFGVSVMLTKNHRSEAQLIVDNASRIQTKKMPVFDPDHNFHRRPIGNNNGYERDAQVKRLLTGNCPDMKSHENSQFVAFRNKDCDAINEICCMFYSGHSIKTDKNKLDFREGDKICCRKNGEVRDYYKSESLTPVKDDAPVPDQNADNSEEKSQADKVKLCNGEIFFIRQVLGIEEQGKKEDFFILDDLQKKVKVNYREFRAICRPKHAWARTIHTYQGSESDTVIYLVGSGRGQTWQHVYTAVTRGKKQVAIISTNSDLQEAVRTNPMPRKTSLKERILKIRLTDKECAADPVISSPAKIFEASHISLGDTSAGPGDNVSCTQDSRSLEGLKSSGPSSFEVGTERVRKSLFGETSAAVGYTRIKSRVPLQYRNPRDPAPESVSPVRTNISSGADADISSDAESGDEDLFNDVVASPKRSGDEQNETGTPKKRRHQDRIPTSLESPVRRVLESFSLH